MPIISVKLQHSTAASRPHYFNQAPYEQAKQDVTQAHTEESNMPIMLVELFLNNYMHARLEIKTVLAYFTFCSW